MVILDTKLTQAIKEDLGERFPERELRRVKDASQDFLRGFENQRQHPAIGDLNVGNVWVRYDASGRGELTWCLWEIKMPTV